MPACLCMYKQFSMSDYFAIVLNVHLQYYHLCKLGCNDPIKTSTAFYVYIEICEGIVSSSGRVGETGMSDSTHCEWFFSEAFLGRQV